METLFESKDNSNDVIKYLIIIIAVIAILAAIFTNAAHSGSWNNGICPNCNIRYELRGVSDRLKYYSCPECGKEVNKY
jgi:PHP family Zn ribbon phosphoesterase